MHAKGQEKLRELTAAVERCMIRRTAVLLTRYLPQKVEMVVCIKMTDKQMATYKQKVHDFERKDIKIQSNPN